MEKRSDSNIFANEEKSFYISIKTNESGNVPIELKVEYKDDSQSYTKVLRDSFSVQSMDSAQATTVFNQPTFYGGYANRDYYQTINNNLGSEDTFQQIMNILDGLSQDGNKSDKQLADDAEITILRDSSLKAKTIKAFKTGLLESLKTHPIGAFLIAAIQNWN